MYAKLDDILKLERETLDVIATLPEFAYFRELQEAAKLLRTRVGIGGRAGVDFSASLLMNIRLRADRRRTVCIRRIDIGGLVVRQATGTVSRASYRVLICKTASPSGPLIRKLHFDYEPIEKRVGDESKPSVHIQICGKLDDYLRREGYKDQQLNAWYPDFEKPRIPCMPMSLALLLNWLLLEFKSDKNGAAILRQPRWRSLVRKAEREMLRPYFRSGFEFLNSTAREGSGFFEAHLYEESLN